MYSYSMGQDQQEKYYSKAWTFYRHALNILQKQHVPFLVGGTYALEHYTGIRRNTRDLDIFVMPKDCSRILEELTTAGYQTELKDPQWLGQVICGDDLIDVIFGAGRHATPVDETWFEHAVEGNILDTPVKLCAPEEMIWTKAFIMDRKRYDGADVAHLLRACSEQISWSHLLRRFGPHWRVLLSHFILFGFIYPDERSRIPDWIMQELFYRAQNELSNPILADRRCQGTLFSETEYLADIKHWGYQDARLVAQEKQDEPEYCDIPLLPDYALWSEPVSGSMQN